MAEYFPHPRDFLCIRENEDALGPTWWDGGGYRVPLDKIFVPTAIGSKAWVDSSTAGYTPGQAWCLWAAIAYNGPLPGYPEYEHGTVDYNTYNHSAGREALCGVFGPMTDEFQAVGKFRSGMCTIARLPVGIFYRGGTEIILEGGPKIDYSAESDPPGTPPADTDIRLYGFLCPA